MTGAIFSEQMVFLSTPSARRATVDNDSDSGCACISIHALREEGDLRTAKSQCHSAKFLSTPSARRATILEDRPEGVFSISIHALREEGDLQEPERLHDLRQFLSTPSARRATPSTRCCGPC